MFQIFNKLIQISRNKYTVAKFGFLINNNATESLTLIPYSAFLRDFTCSRVQVAFRSIVIIGFSELIMMIGVDTCLSVDVKFLILYQNSQKPTNKDIKFPYGNFLTDKSS